MMMMMNKYETPASPLPPAVRPFGGLAAAVYERGVRLRNRKFDCGERVAERLSIPVISIGNISVGGTGKTPMVQWVCEFLLGEGHHPIIAMRGYKADAGGKSDEQIEHEERFDGKVPVIANPKRFDAVHDFLVVNADAFDCCVLDDGFQHRQLARDLDVVLIHAGRSPFEDRLLPAGFLREPVENLSRADAVVLTGADLRDEDRLDLLRVQVGKRHGKAPTASFCTRWAELIFREEGVDRREAVGQLARRRLFAVCAIANPKRFLDQIELRGGIVVGRKILTDHSPYRDRVFRDILRRADAQECEAIITTGKDWVKLRELESARSATIPIVRPIVEISPIDGRSAFEELIRQVFK